jgi:hypothetical protein
VVIQGEEKNLLQSKSKKNKKKIERSQSCHEDIDMRPSQNRSPQRRPKREMTHFAAAVETVPWGGYPQRRSQEGYDTTPYNSVAHYPQVGHPKHDLGVAEAEEPPTQDPPPSAPCHPHDRRERPPPPPRCPPKSQLCSPPSRAAAPKSPRTRAHGLISTPQLEFDRVGMHH